VAWAPDYVTTAELRSFATRSGVTVDDTYLALAVTSASRAVDDYCGRQFGKVDSAEARAYTPEWDAKTLRWFVDIDDLHSVTGLTVNIDHDDDGVYDQAVTDYVLWPRNAPQNGRPWTRLLIARDSSIQPGAWWSGVYRPAIGKEDSVQVSGLFGWASTPSAVKEATLLEGARINQRRAAPFGIAGSPETGSELRLLREVDVDAQKILKPYRRRWGAV
jgi:hypothetical protein